MRLSKKDQVMLAEAYKDVYVENSTEWPRNPSGTTFEAGYWNKISDLIHDMKGSTWQEVKQAISDQLDIRLDNMSGSPLEARIAVVYDRINPGALERVGVNMKEVGSRIGHL